MVSEIIYQALISKSTLSTSVILLEFFGIWVFGIFIGWIYAKIYYEDYVQKNDSFKEDK